MSPVARRIAAALATAAAAVLAIVCAPAGWILPAFSCLVFLAELEFTCLFLKKSRRPYLDVRYLLGLTIIFFGLMALPMVARLHGNLMMLYLIAIVKVSDMGGFALGMSTAKLMKGGNHKLCPSISPGKSWEGLLGSVLASCMLSCAFLPITHFGFPKALTFGIVAALVGTAGDLIESKFKRWVGVKDSATFMPAGLGGFLDMFDSLLFAPAILMPFIA